MFDEDAKLIILNHEKDEEGFPIETRKEIPVYVRTKSVTRTEFYDAMRSNIRTSIVFSMRIEDWKLSEHMVDGRKLYADKIKYDGCEYDVVRDYMLDKSTIEVTCS